MRPSLAVPLLALAAQANVATSSTTKDNPSWFGRASAHLSRAHNIALRHSASLARDLRTTFGAATPPRSFSSHTSSHQPQSRRDSSPGAQKVLDSGHKLYCTIPKDAAGQPVSTGGNSTSTHASTSTRSSASSATQGSPTKSGGGSSASGSSTAVAASSTSTWKVFQSYSGNDFFNGWDFFVGADPTNGAVTFLNMNDAKGADLAYVNDAGNFIMAVETTPQVASTRKSVRITTKQSYNGALIILDAKHMPTGCGTWPAFWSNGPNWPAGGEIDIVEGVSDYIANQATIHTNPGCTIPSSKASDLGIQGVLVGGQDCAAATTGNQGCGVRFPDTKSFGAAFNANGGGVYAMKWDNDGIAIYFFRPDAVPSDISAGSPTPEGWGLPMARWPASGCSPFDFFKDHNTIFDTTLCGDWAEGVWGASGIPGQDQSCAQRTGAATCVDYIKANGQAMAEAYWEVRSVKIYQTK